MEKIHSAKGIKLSNKYYMKYNKPLMQRYHISFIRFSIFQHYLSH